MEKVFVVNNQKMNDSTMRKVFLANMWKIYNGLNSAHSCIVNAHHTQSAIWRAAWLFEPFFNPNKLCDKVCFWNI